MSKRQTIEVKIKEYSFYDILDGMSPRCVIDTMENICEAYGESVFFAIKGYSYDGTLDLELWETRLETDKEYQKRLDAEAATTNKTRAAKLKKEEKERKEYERLKKKFEKGSK